MACFPNDLLFSILHLLLVNCDIQLDIQCFLCNEHHYDFQKAKFMLGSVLGDNKESISFDFPRNPERTVWQVWRVQPGLCTLRLLPKVRYI